MCERVCTPSLSTSLWLRGAALFRSGPSTASQSSPASILSPTPQSHVPSVLLIYPPERILSAAQQSGVPGLLSWSLSFCRKGAAIKRSCQKIELTLQVLSTGDELKRGRDGEGGRRRCLGRRKEEACMETRRTKWRGIDRGQYIDLLTH